jgi:hypothetical protein
MSQEHDSQTLGWGMVNRGFYAGLLGVGGPCAADGFRANAPCGWSAFGLAVLIEGRPAGETAWLRQNVGVNGWSDTSVTTSRLFG